MIKYYIILQPSIHSMGGEEMYTRNKVIDAKEKGFSPIVFHSGIGNHIYIEDLKDFAKYKFSEFRYDLSVVSSQRKKKVLNKIQKILVNCDQNSIIESHEILVAQWGEFIAKYLKIRHIAYMLLEGNNLRNESLFNFFYFKYKRKELVGIEKQTIPNMFSNFLDNIDGVELPAYCQNVFENIPCPIKFRVRKADITIGSISRTNKSMVLPMIDSIKDFTNKHIDKTFNILYIGGSMDKKSENEVKKRLSSIPNAKLYFTGMLFPLSIEMIKQMDVCIASSGSCSVSERCGIPTISVDGIDGKAIGVFNETTKNSLFRDINEPQLNITDLLEDILINKKFIRKNKIRYLNVDFSSHWEFINKLTIKKEYYDISNIKLTFKEKLKSVLLGFYYGLQQGSILQKIIEKSIAIISYSSK